MASVFFGVPLPERDSAEAVAAEMRSIGEELDGWIARVRKVLAE